MEIMLIQNTEISTIQNAKLRQKTEKIAKCFYGACKSISEACVILNQIKTEKLYEKEGFKKFGDYTEKFLNISQAKASKMINTAKRFIETENENLKLIDKSFTVSQVEELLPLNDDTVEEIIENEIVTNDMTTA